MALEIWVAILDWSWFCTKITSRGKLF